MNKLELNINPIARIKPRSWKMQFHYPSQLKRILDVTVSIGALLLLSPIMIMIMILILILILTSILIKLDSRGNILFKQERVGLKGKPFLMWKFRSMVVDAEDKRASLESSNEMVKGVLFKIKHDPRITKVGTYIRKTSIDELPQLSNVLKGEMSIVGPRPPLPSEVKNYQRSDYRRLEALPGITCEWQVAGRSNIPFDQQVELDVHYIRNQSLWLDCVLILKTIPAVLSARGAY